MYLSSSAIPMKAALFLLALLAASCTHSIQRADAPPPLPPTASSSAQPATHGSPLQDADGAHKFFLQQRLAAGMTELPIDRYVAAREHIRAMPHIPVASSVSRSGSRPQLAATSQGWTSVGPGNIGGRTRALAINPQNPDIMYAGSVTGGVWKTTDGGQSWTPLFDSQAVLNIGTLVMDPTDPNTLYAGTGEWYTSFQGDGIYKTTDGGATWTPLISTVNSHFYYVNKIVISPNDHLRLYAATYGGIWMSPDGGNTWTRLITNSATNFYYGCQDIAIRPDMNPDVLFASCSGTLTGDYQIVRNDNAPSGAWAQVMTQHGMGRTSLAIAPSQPSTIYALAADYDASSPYYRGLLAVYRSTTGGAASSWTTQVSNADPEVINTLLLSNARDATSAYCAGTGPVAAAGGQGNYDNVIAVDPTNPDSVWVGGVEVFRSDDAGATWGVASLWQVTFGTSQFAHADRHVIQFHPNYDGAANQTLFLGTDGGLFRTDNARAAVSGGPMGTCLNNFSAKSKVTWTDLNNSYAATQFYHGFAYPGGMLYMGGAQDNSVSRGSDIGGINTWGLFSTGDGTSVSIDPADANHTLESKQNLSLSRAIDGGTFVGSVAGISEAAAKFPFVPFLASDPKEGNHMFLGGTVNLWRSLDGGATWMAAAPVEAKSSVTAIAISPADSNTVLFGTQLGFVYSNPAALAANGNTQWISSKPRSGNVSGLAYDPTNPQIVYATYSTLKSTSTDAHVYKSLDGGATWSPSDGSTSASIPDTPVFRLLVNPYDSSVLYLGSDLGVFVSTDGGATWGHDPNEFSNVIVEDLAFDSVSNPNWLFAFTYGRGAWRTPLAGSPSPACTYSVSPTTLSADAYGSVIPVAVSAPGGCAWSGIPGVTPTAFQVQSPAQGVGDGTAFINVEPNTGAARADKLNIANTVVTVNQSAASAVVGTLGDLSTAPATLTVPGIASISSSTLTSTSSDPVHSCTGSSDFKTAWWRVTPTSSGTLQIQAAGRRSDVYGNSGIAITAYAGDITGAELACATAAQDTTSQMDGVIRFNVSAGTAYLVEVSALGSASSYNGNLTVAATMAASADVGLSLKPSSAKATAGGNPTQFTAQISNAGNTAVRWSISPPIGSISPSGVYTPPPVLSGPVSITITATTFARPLKQATATVIVTPPGLGSGSAPVISSVFNAASGAASIAPNAWITLIGTNLAPDSRSWQGSDFIGGQMPTQLDSVTVTIGGRRAFVYYISSTQVNVLAPVGGLAGSEQVVLTNSYGSSAPVMVPQAAYSPSFFLFGGKYVAATHANGTYLGPEALGAGFTPAAPGETVILYGNGFGQVSPAIVPGAGAQSGTLPAKPTITIGGLNATVSFAGAISPGLYQFNVVVPANAASGDNTVAVTYQDVSGPSGIFLSVAK
jgi:uncharacterized protein (TIGR03437 family)